MRGALGLSAQPNWDRSGGHWSSWESQSTANNYAGENNNRTHENQDRALIVNTTSLHLESPWLEKLSELTQVYYNQIDKNSLTEGKDMTSLSLDKWGGAAFSSHLHH